MTNAQQATPTDWLNRMAKAMREQNYRGTFVYAYGEQLEALRIYHRYRDGSERERLLSLNGAAREILRNDNKVTSIFPDSKEVLVDRRRTRNPLADVVPAETKRLQRGYTLNLKGVGRVAGRAAQKVALVPRGKYRYGYRLWIDRASSVLLRSELIGESDAPIERVMFTELRLPEHIADRRLQPTISGDDYTWLRYEDEPAEASPKGAGPFSVAELPPGFRLAMSERRHLPGREGQVNHRLYSDGLATVSVYIEERDSAIHSFRGHSSMGAMNAFGRRLGDYQLVVVGEVPARTVERFGKAFRLKGQ